MKIETNKGIKTGGAAALAGWLADNQPTFARVLCPCEFGGVEIAPGDPAHRYEDGPALRSALLSMKREALAECCEVAR
jgi:hypothetical protein